MDYKRVESIARLFIDEYKGVSITKDEYILLVSTIHRLLIDALENIDPKADSK